jgi:hypothetical protein
VTPGRARAPSAEAPLHRRSGGAERHKTLDDACPVPAPLRELKAVGFHILKGPPGHVFAFRSGGEELDSTLDPQNRWDRTADVVDEDQLASRAKHTLHLTYGSVWIRNLTKRVRADDGVESRIVERELMGIALSQVDPPPEVVGSRSSDRKHLRAEIDAGEGHGVRIKGEVETCSYGDLERFPRGTGTCPAAMVGAEKPPLDEAHLLVVPMSLLRP